MNSSYKCEVVPVKLEKLENSDNLSIVKVWDYQVVVKTEDWLDKDRGCWCPPDSLVPVDRPEFAFLANGKDTYIRIKARKLRGVVSYGLLIPCHPKCNFGANLSGQLGVQHWNPEYAEPITTGGKSVGGPSVYYSKYDLDAFLKYAREVFIEGEEVWISEKIDGSFGRYVNVDNTLFIGSRTLWKAENDNNQWAVVLKKTPQIKEFCQENPNYILCGEVYGQNSKMPYGPIKGQLRFAAFDILHNGRWLDVDEFLSLCDKYNIPVVPTLYNGLYSFEKVQELSEGPSTIYDGHMREGVVIKSIYEKQTRVGRACLKMVSASYLIKK